MDLNNDVKLEILWKRYRGVSSTSRSKFALNEEFKTSEPVFQKDIWSESNIIPIPAPSSIAATPSDIWANTISPRKRNTAIQLMEDPTSGGFAWIALKTMDGGLSNSNREIKWVPSSFDLTYTVVVWAGNPNGNSSTRLSSTQPGFEWEFDYSSGVLFFPNGVPAAARQNGIWIEGWIYIGRIGVEISDLEVSSRIRTLSFESELIDPGAFVDFNLATGGRCVLVESKVSSPATLECHSTSMRNDSNPYRFKGVTNHLVDDGSYVVMGNRYYGERFINLINMENYTSTETYWRLYNDSSNPRTFTVIVQVS